MSNGRVPRPAIRAVAGWNAAANAFGMDAAAYQLDRIGAKCSFGAETQSSAPRMHQMCQSLGMSAASTLTSDIGTTATMSRHRRKLFERCRTWGICSSAEYAKTSHNVL